jgi:hypothetical protein
VAAHANCAPGAAPSHVPYREALLTTLLRESIGGNSVTSFVLAMAGGEPEQLAHSLKTCTFGALLRTVHNRARPNVEFDPSAAMDDLRAQVATLSATVVSLEKRTTLHALVALCQVSEAFPAPSGSVRPASPQSPPPCWCARRRRWTLPRGLPLRWTVHRRRGEPSRWGTAMPCGRR